MIVLDTTVLVYAVGEDHPLAEPCRRIIEAAGNGATRFTTTAEAIQEFVHVRARRRDRKDAAMLGRLYVDLLTPLISLDENAVRAGLRLFERLPSLGAFDATLAAAAIHAGADALVSADRSFGRVHGLHWVDPAAADLDAIMPEA